MVTSDRPFRPWVWTRPEIGSSFHMMLSKNIVLVNNWDYLIGSPWFDSNFSHRIFEMGNKSSCAEKFICARWAQPFLQSKTLWHFRTRGFGPQCPDRKRNLDIYLKRRSTWSQTMSRKWTVTTCMSHIICNQWCVTGVNCNTEGNCYVMSYKVIRASKSYEIAYSIYPQVTPDCRIPVGNFISPWDAFDFKMLNQWRVRTHTVWKLCQFPVLL